MGKIVRRVPGTPLSPEAIARLQKLEEMSDESIRTDLIPEWTPEQFERALKRRAERLAETAEHLQKAS